MPAAAMHRDEDVVRGGEERAGPEVDLAGLVLGADVDREAAGRGRVEPVEQALLQHHPRAGIALFARLEHQQHRPRQLVDPIHEKPSRTEQHRDVRVVTAGVHRAVDLGREVEARVLVERQRVHVGSQHDRPTGPVGADERGDAGQDRADSRFEAEPPELLDDRLPRLRQMEPLLGMPVDPPPDRGDVG